MRVRGAGRKPVTELDPGIVAALDLLVDPGSRGDPMQALRWTTKLTAHLADELTAQGHRCSARTAAKLLTAMGFSLHGNTQTIEGASIRTVTSRSATSMSISRRSTQPAIQ